LAALANAGAADKATSPATPTAKADNENSFPRTSPLLRFTDLGQGTRTS
jgi:hypothetical protein